MSGDTGLAELLIADREHRYFRSHIDRFAGHPEAISDADVAIYAHGYQGPQRLAAGFALYRAIPLDIASNERHTGTVDAPIQLAFAEYCHATVLPDVAAGLGQAAAGTWPPASSRTADTGLPKSNQPRSRRSSTGSSLPPDARHVGAARNGWAERRFVSPHTVSTHLRHVFETLELNLRLEFVGVAARHGVPAGQPM